MIAQRAKERMGLVSDTRLALLESDVDDLDRRVDRLERKWDWLIGTALVAAGGAVCSVLLQLAQMSAHAGFPQ